MSPGIGFQSSPWQSQGELFEKPIFRETQQKGLQHKNIVLELEKAGEKGNNLTFNQVVGGSNPPYLILPRKARKIKSFRLFCMRQNQG